MEKLRLFPISGSSKGLTLKDKFVSFDEENPHVYENLVYLTDKLVSSGRKKIGMKALFEILRWEYKINTKHGEDEFRLNNNYTSFYARKIMKEHPEHGNVFEIRGEFDR